MNLLKTTRNRVNDSLVQTLGPNSDFRISIENSFQNWLNVKRDENQQKSPLITFFEDVKIPVTNAVGLALTDSSYSRRKETC